VSKAIVIAIVERRRGGDDLFNTEFRGHASTLATTKLRRWPDDQHRAETGPARLCPGE
jgi:hypothetical protein